MHPRQRFLIATLLGSLALAGGCGDKGGDTGAGDGGATDGGGSTTDGGGADGGADCGAGTDDVDCDGATADQDCDDLDDLAYPGATEVCGDDRDEDCDGVAAPCAPAGVVDPRDGVRLLAPEPGGFGGYAVAAVPDLDGDGVGELWASASRASGTAVRGGVAYLVGGPVGDVESLADARLELRGDERDWIGTALAGGADLDDDGVADLLAGAPGDQILEPSSSIGAGPGRVVVMSGLATGTHDADDALALLVGEADGDKAGCDVAASADLDGDGIGDALAGAYLHASGAEAGGAAYVVLGPVSGTRSLSDADARLLGTEAFEQAGASVSAIGDATGDGHVDLLIGADGDEGGVAGKAYVVAGPVDGSAALADVATAVIGSDEVDDNLASTALGGADLDGDDVSDYFLCAYDAGEGTVPQGTAWLVSGPVSGSLTVQADARTQVQGIEGMGHFSEACALAGDVDHDGRTDVLVGAHEHGADLEGRAYLFYDLPAGTISAEDAQAIFIGATTDEDLGWSVAGGQDLTGDGFTDVIIGACKVSETEDLQGAVYVVSGGLAAP